MLFLHDLFVQPEWSLFDFAPLLGVYGIVFLYISFSVGKYECPVCNSALCVYACYMSMYC